MTALGDKEILLISADDKLRKDLCALLWHEIPAVLHSVSPKAALEIVNDSEKQKAVMMPSVIILDQAVLDSTTSQLLVAAQAGLQPIPVIFLYDKWLGSAQSIWLRDILKVALLMYKPNACTFMLEETKKLISRQSDDEAKLPPIVSAPTELESKIARTIEKLRNEVAAEWKELEKAAESFEKKPASDQLKKDFVSRAHKLRGSAGSLGLYKVSQRAAEIEDWVKMFSPDNAQDRQIWWQAIHNSLCAGRTEMNQVKSDTEAGQRNTDLLSALRIILIGCDISLEDTLADQFVSIPFDAVPIAEAPRFLKGLNQSPSAIFLDVEDMELPTILNLLAVLNENIDGQNSPIFLIGLERPGEAAGPLFYAGMKQALAKPVDESLLQHHFAEIASQNHARILLVGQDSAAAQISNAVAKTGFSIELLAEPAQLLNTVEEIEPETVIFASPVPGFLQADLASILHDHKDWHELNSLCLSQTDQKNQFRQCASQNCRQFCINSTDDIALILAKSLKKKKLLNLRPYSDKTGPLKPEVFERRGERCLKNAQQTGGNFSLCLFAIYSSVSSVKSNHSAYTIFGNLLAKRFPAGTLRGRLDREIFAIATRHDDLAAVHESMRLLKTEYRRLLKNKDEKLAKTIGVAASKISLPVQSQTWSELMTLALNELATQRQAPDGRLTRAVR